MLWQRVLEIRRLRQNDPIKYKHPVNDVAILIGVMFCVKLEIAREVAKRVYRSKKYLGLLCLLEKAVTDSECYLCDAEQVLGQLGCALRILSVAEIRLRPTRSIYQIGGETMANAIFIVLVGYCLLMVVIRNIATWRNN